MAAVYAGSQRQLGDGMLNFIYNIKSANLNKLHDEIKEVLKYGFIMPFTESEFYIEIAELEEDCPEKSDINAQILSVIQAHDPATDEEPSLEEQIDNLQLIILALGGVIE